MTVIISGPDELRSSVGAHLGFSGWVRIDQSRVELFARSIHSSGPDTAADASEFLALSLVPALLAEVVRFDGFTMGVNYGCDQVRFPARLRAGDDVRIGVLIDRVDDVRGGLQLTQSLTIESRRNSDPVCVAILVSRLYL